MTDRDSTRARIRAALCDEVPTGRIHKGEKPTPRIDLEEVADLITDVVMWAREKARAA